MVCMWVGFTGGWRGEPGRCFLQGRDPLQGEAEVTERPVSAKPVKQDHSMYVCKRTHGEI